MRRSNPVFWGMLVTLGIAILLGEVLPDYSLASDLPVFPILAIQIQSALQIAIAVFAGAIVARGRFLRPALVLAVLGWGVAVYIAHDIARLANDPDWGDFVFRNLVELLLYIAAAAVGALLGERFYLRRFGNHDMAA